MAKRKRKRRLTKADRSRAAKLGHKKRKARLAREAREKQAKVLFRKRRKAALKGWQTRKRNAKAKRRKASIASGEAKPKNRYEKVLAALLPGKLKDSDHVTVVANADGSVDGELTVATVNATAYDSIIQAGESILPLPGSWVSVGVHFSVPTDTDTDLLKNKKKRPEEPLDKTLRGMGSIFSHWLKGDRKVSATIYAMSRVEDIVTDVQDTSKTNAIRWITYRMYSAKGGKRPW